MNTHQRGAYQPAMDNAQTYDLADDDIEEEEHSRLPLLIVIALLVLAAFAGVVWLAYNQGVARGRSGAAVVISAPDGPVRTVPADAGGTSAPYTGLKVYGQALPPDQEAQASALAPSVSSGIPAGIPASSRVAIPAATPAVAPVVANSDAPPVRLNPDAPTVTTPKAPPPAPAKPIQAAAIVPAAAVSNTAPAQTTPLTSAASGKAVLQIGSYESPEIANGAWNAFKSRYSDVAGTLAQDVQKADLGAKGTWYRLRVGPFTDKTAANTACAKLRSEGATCFVAAP